MAKRYVGILNFDYSRSTDGNARYLIAQALEQVGWTYAETSAFVLESPGFQPFLAAMEILARFSEMPGDVSSLNLIVQLVDDSLTVPGARRADPVASIKSSSRLPLSPPAPDSDPFDLAFTAEEVEPFEL